MFLAPIISAIGAAASAAGSFIAGLGIFGKALLSIGLNVAVGLIEKARLKKQTPPPSGVQFDRQYGGEVPRTVAIGLVGIAGHDCYVNTHGAANSFLQQVYTFSDYPCDGLSRVAINGNWVTLGSTPDPSGRGLPVTSGEFANLIWVLFVDGNQTTANAQLVANANPSDRWTSNHKGIGICHAIVSMTFDAEKNASFPDFFFEIRGARLYDWRKDSTAGGSGSHRWNNPATHEFSENPIVGDYNYRRGFSVGGDLFLGMAMAAGDLPLHRYTSAANLCDETVSSEPRYRVSVILGSMTPHGDNIESLMLACGGMVIDGIDGSWPLVGSDQPTVATLTDDDLIVGAPVQFQARRSMAELVNSVSGNRPDPDQIWSMVGYEAQINAGAVVVDRRTRDLNIDFPTVRSGRQAEQLASIYLEENRWEASAAITVRPRWQVLEPGDWIVWDSERYGEKTYIVVEVSLASLESSGPRNVQLTLQERDGAIYDGITASTVNVPFPPGAPTYLAEVADFAVIPVTATGADGRARAAIRASWSTLDDDTIIGVRLRYRPVAQPDVMMTKAFPRDQTVAILVEGVVANTLYEVSSRIITQPERTVAWSAWHEVTTSEVWVILEDFAPVLREYQDWIGKGVRDVIEELRAVAANAASGAISGYSEVRTLRRELVATAGEITAAYREEILIATGPDSALSQSIVTLQAAIGDIESSYTAAILAATGPDSAIVESIEALEASIGGVSASANFRASVYAGPAGYSSRIGFEGRVLGTGIYRTASLFLDIPASTAVPTRVAINAQQFIIIDGSTTVQPFVFTGGTAYMENARIGTVYFNQLSSNNGKLLLKGSGSLASIEIFS